VRATPGSAGATSGSGEAILNSHGEATPGTDRELLERSLDLLERRLDLESDTE